MKLIKNPFRPVKFEDEEHPLIYQTPEALKQFHIGNYYFTGNRGCGKTTCLKLADTEFRMRNNITKFEAADESLPDVFGVYISLNNRKLPSFSPNKLPLSKKKMLRSKESVEQVISEFLELFILKSILSSLCRLVRLKKQNVQLEAEDKICKIIDCAYRIGETSNIDAMTHLIQHQLVATVEYTRGYRDEIPNFRARIENPFHEVVKDLVGEIRKGWPIPFIRILIDDCEVFEPEYQRALNSLVRAPKGAAIAWSIAFVEGRFDLKTTNIVNQSAQREEREIVRLNGQGELKFRKFANAVARLRVRRSLGEQVEFNTAVKLGSFDINELVEASLQTSRSKRTLDFVQRAKAVTEGLGVTRNTPYWEYYLFMNKVSPLINNSDPNRKKNVASYVSICSRYGLNMKYAGSGVIESLADSCIRDYLETLASIFDIAVQKEKIDVFMNNERIPLDIQSEGCQDASNKKFDGIKEYTEINAYYVSQLVECLGEAVARFQRAQTAEPLRNPDRAIFSILLRDIRRVSADFEVIKSAEVDGYIREIAVPARPNTYNFRLHRLLAPKFEVAYREADDIFIPLRWPRVAQTRELKLNPKVWAESVHEDFLTYVKNRNVGQGALWSDEEI
jgi:hypothetical protein